jgi:hypothetical protein
MPYNIDSELPAKIKAEAEKFANLYVYRSEGKGPNSPTSRRGLTVFSVPVGKPEPVGAVIERAFKERGEKAALTAKSDIRYAQGGERGGGVVIALLRRAPDGSLLIANEDGIPVPNAALLEAAGRNPNDKAESFFAYGDTFFAADSDPAAAVSALYYPEAEAEAAKPKGKGRSKK